jgi:hypothetical protein
VVFSSSGGAFVHRGKPYAAGDPGVPRMLEVTNGKPAMVVGHRWGIPEIK